MNKKNPRKKKVVPGTAENLQRRKDTGAVSFTPVGLQQNPNIKRWANSDKQNYETAMNLIKDKLKRKPKKQSRKASIDLK